jgi:hypothetical protein
MNQKPDPAIQAYKKKNYQTLTRERRERKRMETRLPERRHLKEMNAG